MSDRTRRRWTPSEKQQIVESARRDGLAVSEVCRRNGIAPTQFYDWERRMKDGATEGLRVAKSKPRKARDEDLRAEIIRLKGIVTEVVEENIRIKKGLWP